MLSRAVLVHVALGLVALVAGFAWALSSPPGSSPDDDYHLSSIWCPPPVETSGCPWKAGPDGTAALVGIPAQVSLSSCFATKPEQSGVCSKDLGNDLYWTARFDKGGYPGPYYRIMHVFVSADVDRSVIVMRFVNLLLGVALIGAASLALKPQLRTIAGVGLTASIVPLGAFLIVSTNPSSWSVTGVAATALGLIAAFTGDTRARRIAGSTIAVVGAVLAAVARSDSGLFLGMVLFSLLVLYFEKAWRQRWTWPVLGVIAIAAVWALTHGAQATLPDFGTQQTDSGLGLLAHNVADVVSLPAGVYGVGWGGLGWLDTPMPAMVGIPALAVAVAIATVGFASMSLRKGIALLAPVAGAILLPLFLLMRAGDIVGNSVQPRYVLPAVVVMTILMLLDGRGERAIRFGRVQAIALVAMLAEAHALALWVNTRRYVTADDNWSPKLDSLAQWWWPVGPGPTLTVVVGAVAFAALLTGVWWVMLRPKAHAPRPPEAIEAQDVAESTAQPVVPPQEDPRTA